MSDLEWVRGWAHTDDGVPETDWEEGYEAARRVVKLHLDAPRPLLTDEGIDRATAQDRDALLDHIYEYGTAAEGVLERIRKLCRTIERKVRGEEE